MVDTTEPTRVASHGIPRPRNIGEEYLDYKVRTKDSIESIAKRAGMKWEVLAEFNYGTRVPDEINWYLREYVGCTKETGDHNNYVFDSADDPGIVHIPLWYKKASWFPVVRAGFGRKKILSTLKTARPTMEVVELSLPTGFDLANWYTDEALDKVVWKKTANPDLPSAFVRGQAQGGTFRAKIKIRRVKGNHGSKQFSIRAVGMVSNGHDSGYKRSLADGKPFPSSATDEMTQRIVLQKDNVIMAGRYMEVDDIVTVEGKLPDKVMISRLSLRWSYSYDKKTWVNMGRTGPHKIYLVDSDPLAKLGARLDDQTLYDLGLEKACGYVNGDTDVHLALCVGIPADRHAPKYNPATMLDETMNPLYYYQERVCLCLHYARLMEYLCHTIGIDASLTIVWGGKDTTTMNYYFNAAGTLGASFRVLAPKNNMAPKNPHFVYHAITKSNGKDYDATYGKEGTTKLNETAMKKEPGKPYKDWKVRYPRIVHTGFYTAKEDSEWKCKH